MKDHALQDVVQGNWKKLSGSVRHEWGKLTHNDVEQIKGDAERLAGFIEERYGVTKMEARKQIEKWVARLNEHKGEEKKSQAAESESAN